MNEATVARLFLALCAVNFFHSAGASEHDEDQWKVAHHSRVVLFYPPGWTIRTEIPEALLELSPGGDGGVRAEDQRLLLQIKDPPDGETFDSFVDRQVAALREELDDSTILGDEPARRGPHSGHAVELSHQSGGREARIELFFFEQGDDVFLVTLSGESSAHETTRPVFHRIIAGIHPLKEIFPTAYFHQDFVIQFPEDWTVKEGLPGTVVAAISPKTKGNDPFQERLTVGYERIPDGMSFDEYVDRNFKILLTRLRRAREQDRDERTVAGERARSIELSHHTTGVRTILRVTMVPSEERAFTLIASGIDPDYSRMEETFDRILNSFASPTPPGKDSRTQ
ncbi:MAG: DcrB-related protein [Puniceicoccaceae bacterium]